MVCDHSLFTRPTIKESLILCKFSKYKLTVKSNKCETTVSMLKRDKILLLSFGLLERPSFINLSYVKGDRILETLI